MIFCTHKKLIYRLLYIKRHGDSENERIEINKNQVLY